LTPFKPSPLGKDEYPRLPLLLSLPHSSAVAR
jgi:hypothetical protein